MIIQWILIEFIGCNEQRLMGKQWIHLYSEHGLMNCTHICNSEIIEIIKTNKNNYTLSKSMGEWCFLCKAKLGNHRTQGWGQTWRPCHPKPLSFGNIPMGLCPGDFTLHILIRGNINQKKKCWRKYRPSNKP
jgi:hypothetical protein